MAKSIVPPKPPSFLGHRHTPESNEKNRLAHLGKKASKATRAKMGAVQKALWADPEYRTRMLAIRRTPEFREKARQGSLGNKNCVGHVVPQETRDKISAALTGRRRRKKAKKIGATRRVNPRKLDPYVCSIPGCGRPGFCKGWCSGHYSSNYRHGDPLTASDPVRREAKISKMAATKRANPTRFWLGKKRGPHSVETRDKMSASHKANGYCGPEHHLFGVLPPHRKRCVYRGVKYRSTYEVRFAKMLDLMKVKHSYESKTFDLGDTTYTPDFYLPRYRLWVEVKGWMSPSAEKKISSFRSRYPKERFAIIPKTFFRNNLDQRGN